MSSTTASNLACLGLVDDVGAVLADHRPVRRDRDDAQLVGLVKLGGLGLGRAGHAGELLVEPEVVLQRDRGEGLVLVLDLHLLLGLDGLVHALVVAPAGQHAAGELVDDEHLAVGDDVLLVAVEELLGLQRVVQVADQRGVDRLVEVVDAELVLDELDALLGDGDRALVLLDLVVGVALHQRHDPGELAVPLGAGLGRAADDQRGAGLVDEDRVDLVDDREVVPALHQVGLAPGHVVAQVVEAELVVRAVGDVAGVLLAPVRRLLAGQDDADRQAEEPVHPAHPLGVALGQVVVDRDDVHAVAGQRVEVGRQHAGEGLALTGLHLGDVAQVQRGAAHDLHAEVPLAERAGGRLADDGERLGQQLVEGLAVGVALLELVGLGLQLGVGQVGVVVGERLDRVGDLVEPSEDLALAGTEESLEHHGPSVGGDAGTVGRATGRGAAVTSPGGPRPRRPGPRRARLPHRAAPGHADHAARRRQPARRPGRGHLRRRDGDRPGDHLGHVGQGAARARRAAAGWRSARWRAAAG